MELFHTRINFEVAALVVLELNAADPLGQNLAFHLPPGLLTEELRNSTFFCRHYWDTDAYDGLSRTK